MSPQEKCNVFIRLKHCRALSNRWFLAGQEVLPAQVVILTEQVVILSEYIYRPRIAQWLEHLLGVREAGVRSPTASHQGR